MFLSHNGLEIGIWSEVNETTVFPKVIQGPRFLLFCCSAILSWPKLVHPHYNHIPTMGNRGKQFHFHSHLTSKNSVPQFYQLKGKVEIIISSWVAMYPTKSGRSLSIIKRKKRTTELEKQATYSAIPTYPLSSSLHAASLAKPSWIPPQLLVPSSVLLQPLIFCCFIHLSLQTYLSSSVNNKFYK